MKLSDIKTLNESASDLESKLRRFGVLYSDSDEEMQMFISVLEEYCAPWFKEWGGIENYLNDPLYRGIRSAPGDVFYKPIRTNRKSLDTHPFVQNMINEILKSEGAVAHRSNSAFVTPLLTKSEAFGRPFMVFPVGDYHYTWLDTVIDLTPRINVYVREAAIELEGDSGALRVTNMNSLKDVGDEDSDDHKIAVRAVEIFENKDRHKIRVDEKIKSANREEIMISASGLIYVDVRDRKHLMRAATGEEL